MSQQGIEVNQVHEAQTMEIFLCHIDGLLHAVNRALGLVGLSDTLAHKDVVDLSNGNDIITGTFKRIQSSRTEWL